MIWRERIQQLTDTAGWRGFAPAGASVLAHGMVIGGVAGIMAVMPPTSEPRQQTILSVELVAPQQVAIPEPLAGVTPPPRLRPAEATAPAEPRTAPAPQTSAPAATANDAIDGVYLGPPSILKDPKTPPGLAGLMGQDPCEQRYGPKAKECAGRDLAAKTGKMDSMMPRSKEDLAQHFAEYMPTCALRVGCEGGEWISTNGTRSVGRPPPGSSADRGVGTPGAGGAASLGGLHTSVGRLGFNPDHRDPGFGD